MDAKTFYRMIFVGNEPYKNHMKRRANQLLDKPDEDNYWNILMLIDLNESMKYYVRKTISISGMFKILVFKISKLQWSKCFVIEI